MRVEVTKRVADEIFPRLLEAVMFVTNCHVLEAFAKVAETHPKGAVVFRFEIHSLFKLGSPQRRMITPVTIPFKSSPWVTDIY